MGQPFVIQLENRPGELAHVTRALAMRGINIQAIAGSSAGTFSSTISPLLLCPTPPPSMLFDHTTHRRPARTARRAPGGARRSTCHRHDHDGELRPRRHLRRGRHDGGAAPPRKRAPISG